VLSAELKEGIRNSELGFREIAKAKIKAFTTETQRT